MKEFADGVGPVKGLIERNPEIVRWAHDAGLTVTPWTFRSDSTGRFNDAREERTGGKVDRLTNPPINTYVKVTEGAGGAKTAK